LCASKNLLDTDKFSNSNERVQRWASQIEPEERQAAFEKSDVNTGRRKAAPEDREAAYDVTPRGGGAAYKITLGRRQAVPEAVQVAFAERDAAFGRKDAAFERRLLDVDHRKIVSQHQPVTEMTNHFSCMLARSSLGAGIDFATEIALSQVGVGIDT
jgi:hypothetical protein